MSNTKTHTLAVDVDVCISSIRQGSAGQMIKVLASLYCCTVYDDVEWQHSSLQDTLHAHSSSALNSLTHMHVNNNMPTYAWNLRTYTYVYIL